VHQVAAPSPPRRLRADAARNQQRIIAAARELFADRGLDITLDDVAERAGVGVGTVYRRFSNKRELIAEVFEQNMREFAQEAEQAARHPDPWLGLVEFFQYACRHLADNRGFAEVLLDLADDPERFAHLRDRITPTIATIIERAHDAGALQPEIEPSDFLALVHMVDAVAAFAKPVNPNVWQRYAAIVLNGVRAGEVTRVELPVGPLREEDFEQAKLHACTDRRR